MLDRRKFLIRGAVVSAAAALASPRIALADEERHPIDAELVGWFVSKSPNGIIPL